MRWLIAATAAAVLLAGCARERPVHGPVATAEEAIGIVRAVTKEAGLDDASEYQAVLKDGAWLVTPIPKPKNDLSYWVNRDTGEVGSSQTATINEEL